MPAKKPTVVTADDDAQLLRLIARNLEFEEYQVLTASDGEQALRLVEAHAPDLVLLDVMMPKMDGFTACQRIREFSSVPIIIITAQGQDRKKVHGLDLGADDRSISAEELPSLICTDMNGRLFRKRCLLFLCLGDTEGGNGVFPSPPAVNSS